MASDQFVLLRGTPNGRTFLAHHDRPDDVDTWTEDRDAARRFADRADADEVRKAIVARDNVAAAVVPDRVGPGPDRPEVHR